MTETVKITPIFACFTFDTLPQARAAWKACDERSDIKNVSVWSSNPGTPLIVILGERSEDVDRAAAVVQDCAGYRANYILPEALRRFFISRRWGTLTTEIVRRLAAGETVSDIERAGIRQRRSDQT